MIPTSRVLHKAGNVPASMEMTNLLFHLTLFAGSRGGDRIKHIVLLTVTSLLWLCPIFQNWLSTELVVNLH